jgi:hypothetical protein
VSQARVHTGERDSELLDGAIRDAPVLLDPDGARNPDVPVGSHDVAVVANRLWLAGHKVAFDHRWSPHWVTQKNTKQIAFVPPCILAQIPIQETLPELNYPRLQAQGFE